MPHNSTTPAPRRNRKRTVLASAVLVAAAATATFALTLNGTDSHTPEPAARPAPSATTSAPGDTPSPDNELAALARREKTDPQATGRADAPVVLIEYSDFQCPFCGQFARETQPALQRSYVDQGILRIEWRNFPIFGKESQQAALAGWAAGRQHKFWEFHTLAYSEPHKRNTGHFDQDQLTTLARKAGVEDLDRFRADMTSAAAHKAVQRDQEEGYALGVTSTPAFLVNGTPLLGAQPTDTFRKAIDAAAKAARP
ncbi:MULTISPECIES: thioredoxin domain-containing protein [unclassified Streptomyces]|uniref:DsbA family protein n=1 Tax=unclassified Streptomyces TaxID=2593676 RepID=UPI0022508D5A|nr:thioredoxin domain-containing protein [Streptomyces sp. NBC_01500]MCX4550459.1 thioredoxin domain-containing protein [Streptomyces sp. NBC_01500]WSV55867.1 thioredoxin domain-containing protein [Streptomyces sp. NBC_01014]